MKVNKKKLKLAMANVCMDSRDLAVAANLPRPTLNNAITGRNLRPATIGKIAKALNVPVEQILEE
ncbi:helix-turn-helix domain-containing protein [Intestinimonas massiliensis (ex Afouda et al. 2020)]|uniref:helix-turn-helix domain-containing protein n=1 Tax=Intestinimonas massiliensis (ex Afouda et al. 2020) TaxID=1673721 RepID=UPI001FA73AEE|nr:helix-turn-helix transcriptional regulator [Intestinimonas massiliensis (ex Afouda et al. 2020)]